jgi:hypothetical protein
MKAKARTCNNRSVAGSHVAQRRGYSSVVIDRRYRRLPVRLLLLVLVLSFDLQGFAGTDLPSRYAFDRYTPLLKGAHFFGPSRISNCSRKIYAKDIYVESITGDVVRLRSVRDPSFSMTFRMKSEKLSPPKIWKTPDISP